MLESGRFYKLEKVAAILGGNVQTHAVGARQASCPAEGSADAILLGGDLAPEATANRALGPTASNC